MKVQIHLPRQSEAEIKPPLSGDLTIRPKFYKKTGLVPILHFTTIDGRNREERYVMLLSATSRQVRIEKLVEVIPDCDIEEQPNAEVPSEANS